MRGFPTLYLYEAEMNEKYSFQRVIICLVNHMETSLDYIKHKF